MHTTHTMARPHPNQNVSFSESVPPSRRAAFAENEVPPRPPAKNFSSKTSLTPIVTNASSQPGAPALGYDEGYVDASNPRGFSSSNGADVRRKKSMVKPERERIDPNHRLWHYRERAAEDQMNVMPSCEWCSSRLLMFSHRQSTLQSTTGSWCQSTAREIPACTRKRRSRSRIWSQPVQAGDHPTKGLSSVPSCSHSDADQPCRSWSCSQ